MILALIVMFSYLKLKTPSIYVPDQIREQWDSVWLANVPCLNATGGGPPCSANSLVMCMDAKEYLGCVKIQKDFFGGWAVSGWVPARNQKRLPFVVTGDCDTTYNATWHIHPARLDSLGRLQYLPELSGYDLQTVIDDPIIAGIMTYKPGKMTAAITWRGHLVYPVRVQ